MYVSFNTKKIEEWHEWYAWLPAHIGDDKFVFFGKVERIELDRDWSYREVGTKSDLGYRNSLSNSMFPAYVTFAYICLGVVGVVGLFI